jgi:gluconate 2-dehydrogenase gamma chain
VSGALGGPARSVLAAALERILPEDEHGPGAAALGVVGYVEGAIERAPDGVRARWREALLGLDALAQAAGGSGFAQLGGAAQDALLAELAAGRAAGVADGAAFFEELRARAIEGAFCDPAHGGNAGGAGWRLLGYAGPRRTWGADDQRIVELA